MEVSLMMMILTHPLMWIVILILLTAVILRKNMRSGMAQCKDLESDSKMTGGSIAELILQEEGLYDVQVKCMDFSRGDHYNSKEKTIYLSGETYYGTSIYALASAAHQCGHAKQHSEDYCSMNVRSIVVTVLSIVSFCGLPLMIMGIFRGCDANTIQLASVMLVGAIFFQLLSLPIEFNASNRAMTNLVKYELVPAHEWEWCKKALRAAALTYLASNAMTANTLLRFVARR